MEVIQRILTVQKVFENPETYFLKAFLHNCATQEPNGKLIRVTNHIKKFLKEDSCWWEPDEWNLAISVSRNLKVNIAKNNTGNKLGNLWGWEVWCRSQISRVHSVLDFKTSQLSIEVLTKFQTSSSGGMRVWDSITVKINGILFVVQHISNPMQGSYMWHLSKWNLSTIKTSPLKSCLIKKVFIDYWKNFEYWQKDKKSTVIALFAQKAY